MLEYDRIDVSEGNDPNKTDGMRQYIICHYSYFLGVSYRFQSKVCNDRQDLIKKAISFNDAGIVSVIGNN